MNPLIDIVGRQILLRLGYTPDQIATGLQKMKAGLPDQNPRIDPKGQTNLFSQAGNLRNFRSGGATMSPTLSPVESRGATLNPRPTYPGRPSAPGQMSIFGTNPNATVTAANLRTAPTVPAAGSMTKTTLENFLGNKRVQDAAVNRALRANALGKNLSVGRGGATASVLGVANFVQDLVLQRFFPETYELKQANLVGTDMNTTREDIRAQRETLKQVQEALNKPPVETKPSTKPVKAEAPLQVTTDDSPTPLPAPRQRVQPKPRVAPVAATAPVAPKESAYGASGKELYMKAKGRNPLMMRYFGENYASDKIKKFS
jgi:hypothetical protein